MSSDTFTLSALGASLPITPSIFNYAMNQSTGASSTESSSGEIYRRHVPCLSCLHYMATRPLFNREDQTPSEYFDASVYCGSCHASVDETACYSCFASNLRCYYIRSDDEPLRLYAINIAQCYEAYVGRVICEGTVDEITREAYEGLRDQWPSFAHFAVAHGDYHKFRGLFVPGEVPTEPDGTVRIPETFYQDC